MKGATEPSTPMDQLNQLRVSFQQVKAELEEIELERAKFSDKMHNLGRGIADAGILKKSMDWVEAVLAQGPKRIQERKEELETMMEDLRKASGGESSAIERLERKWDDVHFNEKRRRNREGI